MNKTALTVGSAVIGGALSKGITGMIEVSNPVKIIMSLVLCAGSGYMASQVSGSDNKASLLQGAYMGVSVAQGLEMVKAIASTDAVSQKLNPETKFGRFAQKATGLSGASGMLNGTYFDVDGNLHNDGLAGYLSASGELNAYDDALNAIEEEGLYADEEEGLYADDEEGLYADEEEGLYADEEEGLYADEYED